MASVGLIPALGLLAGASFACLANLPLDSAAWALLPLLIAVVVAWRLRAAWVTVAVLATAFVAAGAVLAADARARALDPSLRRLLEAHIGGFDIDTPGPERDHDPVPTRAVLVEDAAPRDGFVSLRARVLAVSLDRRWYDADGGVSLSVSGDAAAEASIAWRAGRIVEAPVSFRRPARFLDDGVPDFEREAALDGTALFGSIKSGLAIDVVHRGTPLEEAAAAVRAHVRRAVARWIAPHDAVAAAVVTAVLIGDRTGLPVEVRDRLQAAGTYHVIAISGGNIAILAGLVLGLLTVAGVRGRAAAWVAIAVLLVYAQIATAGPSVWRATLMAVLYFGARLFDHRTAPWQAASVAAALMVVTHPLDVRDPGFILTFGATVALLEGARRGRAWLPRRRVAAWLTASVLASLATEIALVPVSAQAFSRVTGAGPLLNLVAVPMMAIAQIAGVVVAAAPFDGVASAAGWIGYAAAHLLIESSRLVDAAPWLTLRVPAPGAALVVLYYVALASALVMPRPTRTWSVAALVCLLALIAGVRPLRWLHDDSTPPWRWTVFDVGQAEAMLLEVGGGSLQVDAGGAPFGTSTFDVGARVLAPALWARGVHGLDALLITHGDPDHLGGAPAVADAFSPARLWEGIDVPRHAALREFRDRVRSRGRAVEARVAGESFDWHGARIRVLHPPAADWERPRVRNDDSVVLEIVYGDVALLLTGDISSGVEREIAARLTAAPIRLLKVAHHGSRTSTSQALLDAWRPQYAVISAGRGNTFGHPAPEVLRRLESIGARILRTDRHGQITIETDGRGVDVRTFVEPRSLSATENTEVTER